MSRNSRNGLYSRMERQELSLMSNIMKPSVQPPVPERKPIRDDFETQRVDYELKNSFRL